MTFYGLLSIIKKMMRFIERNRNRFPGLQKIFLSPENNSKSAFFRSKCFFKSAMGMHKISPAREYFQFSKSIGAICFFAGFQYCCTILENRIYKNSFWHKLFLHFDILILGLQ